MICGFLALPTCFATALPAIVTGHIAWSRATKEGKPPGRAKLGLIFGYGAFVMIPVIAALAGLTAPLVVSHKRKSDMSECMSNMKQIGLALMEFEAENGTFPDDLMTLESEGFTTNIEILLHVNPKYPGDWFYNPKADPGEPSAVLLVSPEIGQRQFKLHVDSSVRSEEILSGDSFSIETGGDFIAIPVPR